MSGVHGALRRVLEAAATLERCARKDLRVLSPQADPFTLDTPAQHRDGQWFAEQVARFVPGHQTIHVRGLHYLLISDAAVLMPNGMPYTNTGNNAAWFSEKASKAARWLGYVPFERLVDERNAAPEVHVRRLINPRPKCRVVFDDLQVITLETADLLPSVYCEDLAAEQPYRIIMIGEKTSLGPALRRPWGVDEVLLPSGEPSDTMIAGMASRANEDDRPAVVLYFSDFDPGGHQMPISVSRKLQALRLWKYPTLDIQVIGIGGHLAVPPLPHHRAYGSRTTAVRPG